MAASSGAPSLPPRPDKNNKVLAAKKELENLKQEEQVQRDARFKKRQQELKRALSEQKALREKETE